MVSFLKLNCESLMVLGCSWCTKSSNTRSKPPSFEALSWAISITTSWKPPGTWEANGIRARSLWGKMASVLGEMFFDIYWVAEILDLFRFCEWEHVFADLLRFTSMNNVQINIRIMRMHQFIAYPCPLIISCILSCLCIYDRCAKHVQHPQM